MCENFTNNQLPSFKIQHIHERKRDMPKSSFPVESHKLSCSRKISEPSFTSSQVNFLTCWAISTSLAVFWIWVELSKHLKDHKDISFVQSIFFTHELRQTILVTSSIELACFIVLISWFWKDFIGIMALLWRYFMEPKTQKLIRSPKNGGLGRLLVFEGTDGVGKSTQLEKLYHHLEKQGFKVKITRWNKNKARKYEAKTMTPEELNQMYLHGFFSQLDQVILPALDAGCIVLSDRYYYTALARDQTRGVPLRKLKQQYNGIPQPDMIFYFDLPVEQTKQRIFHRADEREMHTQAGELSDEEKEKIAGLLKPIGFYEAGLDLKLAVDPVDNFTIFQNRVRTRYHEMKNHFNFTMIDASQPIDMQHKLLLEYVQGVIQPPHQFHRTLRLSTALLVLTMLATFLVALGGLIGLRMTMAMN